MSTLAEPAVLALCIKRLGRLTPDATARWGRMNVHQMVCHLNDSFRAGMGERQVSSAANPFTRTFVKWVALRTPFPWPHGVPTRPEMEQGVGGTPPADWLRDVAELRASMETFENCKTYGVHPIFGSMSQQDWLVWGYRHADHHFRQFGV